MKQLLIIIGFIAICTSCAKKSTCKAYGGTSIETINKNRN